MKRVAIVGGGVTGLSTAYHLEKQESADVEIHLFEGQASLGGKVKTSTTQNCVVEEGADSILLKPGSSIDRLIDQLGIRSELITPQERVFSIQRNGQLHQVPLGMLKSYPRNIVDIWRCSLFSFFGKVQATFLPIIRTVFPKQESVDPSIAEFLRARFGREVSEHLYETVFGGIHSGNATELSFRSLYPHLMKKPHKSRANAGRFYSLKAGMGKLIDYISAALRKTKVTKDICVQSVEDMNGVWRLHLSDGRTKSFDSVVLALPAYKSAELLQNQIPSLSKALSEIQHASSAIVTIAVPRESCAVSPVGSGYLLSPSESGIITGCTYSSMKWGGRASEDVLLCRVFFGRNAGKSQVEDEQYIRLALGEIREKLQCTGEPFFVNAKRWDNGLPQYRCGHQQILSRCDEILTEHPGLFLTGSSYRGVGIPDCVRQGEETAIELEKFILRDNIQQNNGVHYGESVCA